MLISEEGRQNNQLKADYSSQPFKLSPGFSFSIVLMCLQRLSSSSILSVRDCILSDPIFDSISSFMSQKMRFNCKHVDECVVLAALKIFKH